MKPDSALLIVGHGSTENPDSSYPTYLHALTLRRQGCFGEVQCCFWKEQPSMREVLYAIESDEVYIVPNFISEGYFTQQIIPRELELTGPVTRRGNRILKYCQPVGNHSKMSALLLNRAREIAAGVPPERSSLVIVGHGTHFNENSSKAAQRQVEHLQRETDYAEVLNLYMEESPHVADWETLTSCENVIVVPFFIADGLHSYQDIPVLLGVEGSPGVAASQREYFRKNPHRIKNRLLYYSGAIGTDPLMADVILDQVVAFDAAHETLLA